MSTDDTTTPAAGSDDSTASTSGPDDSTTPAAGPDDSTASTSGSDVRAARRAQREAERAARAQRKADAARERAMAAAQAGGLFEGMSASGTNSQKDSDAGASTQSTPGDRPYADAGTTATTSDDAPDSRPTREPLDPGRRKKLTAALAAASVVLLVVTGLATWQYTEARDAAATEQAVADADHAATEAARQIATQMFTYDHRTVDADLAAVRERLTEPALTEFVEQSMPAVASAAKQQEASVYATVAAAAPMEVTDAEHVTVLVMLNRMVSTKEAPEAASSASRLNLSMVNVDGTWKLGELEAL